MDASLYYTDITPDVDLLLQNVTLTVNRPRNNDIAVNASPKIVTSSSSIDNKKSVTFEDDDVFALYNINLSIRKVRIILFKFFPKYTHCFKFTFYTGTIDWHYGQDWKWKNFTLRWYLGGNYKN